MKGDTNMFSFLSCVPWYWWLFIVIAIVFSIVMTLFRPQIRGALGEGMLDAYMRKHLDAETYTVIHNVMLPIENNATTQIDHIVVSKFGVFVIETKTYKGWIFGDERSEQWTQSLPGGKKFRFQNPLRQNYRHTKTLSALICIPDNKIIPVIAFSGEATFKTKMPANVMKFGNVPDYIKSFTAQVFSDQQLPDIITGIRKWEDSLSSQQKRDHVKNLKRTHGQN